MPQTQQHLGHADQSGSQLDPPHRGPTQQWIKNKMFFKNATLLLVHTMQLHLWWLHFSGRADFLGHYSLSNTVNYLYSIYIVVSNLRMT